MRSSANLIGVDLAANDREELSMVGEFRENVELFSLIDITT